MNVENGNRAPVESLSDMELVEQAKRGGSSAFAELWRRHSSAGRTVARSFTSSTDPDDLVSEAFANIFQAIQRGGGPTGAFRPYLFTTIRNTAVGWSRKLRHEQPIDDLGELEDPLTSEDRTVEALDRSLTAQAFRSLPTRWQEALWYSEVESMSAQEIGPLLGMKANAVAALTYRAREGLRQAWIQAHLTDAPVDSECRWVIERLGSFTRGHLGNRDAARLRAHLADCARCAIVAEEAEDVGSRLAMVLLPLAAGVAGAAGYVAWLQAGAPATVVAMGSSVAGLVGSGSGGTAAGSSGIAGAAGAGSTAAGSATAGVAGTGLAAAGVSTGLVAAIVGGVVVVAGIAAAALLGPTLFAPTPSSAEAVVEPTAAPSDEASAPPTTVPTPTSTALPTPSPTPTTVPTAVPAPEATSVPVAQPSATAVPRPTTPAAPVAEPTAEPSATPEPTPTPTPTPSATPVPPRVDLTADPNGQVFPSLAGSAEPGARILVEHDGTLMAQTTADDDGAWRIPVVAGLPVGTSTLTIVQIGADGVRTEAAPVTVALTAPTIIAASTAADGVPFTFFLIGASGAVEVLVDGEVADTGSIRLLGTTATVTFDGIGEHTLAVRYTSSALGDVRVGPTDSTTIIVREPQG